MMNASILVVCTGHKTPVFELPFEEFTIVTSDKLIVPGSKNKHVATDCWSGSDTSYLSEYNQLFWLANSFDLSPYTHIYTFQYRKFISVRRPATISSNLSYAYAASPAEASQLFPSRTELQSLNGTILTGPALKIRSLAANYADDHIIEDFVTMVSCLTSVSSFDIDRLLRFTRCNVLVPSPSLAFTTVSVFIYLMRNLWDAWKALEPYYQPRTGYQRRAGGYLLERLHSYLLWEMSLKRPDLFRTGFYTVATSSESIEMGR